MKPVVVVVFFVSSFFSKVLKSIFIEWKMFNIDRSQYHFEKHLFEKNRITSFVCKKIVENFGKAAN